MVAIAFNVLLLYCAAGAGACGAILPFMDLQGQPLWFKAIRVGAIVVLWPLPLLVKE